MEKDFKAAQAALLAAEKIILITHRRPDGDACGSILALYSYLLSLNKNPKIFVNDAPPPYFRFLPYFEAMDTERRLLEQEWDLVVYLDVGDVNYAGLDGVDIKARQIINIDHHFTNLFFGDLNLVEDGASSTCEVLFDFFKNIDFSLDIKIATCLLNGILSDTSGFSNAATSARCMTIAAELVQCGASLKKIGEHVLKTKTISGLRLWGLILSRFRINQHYGIGYTYVTESDLKQFNVKEEEIDGLANFLNVLAEAPIGMFLKIFSDRVNVNLRTKQDDIDVSQIAFLFGGGGHKKAAGFTINWRVEERDGRLRVL